MSSKLIIILALASAALQMDMPCIHVWEKDYVVFLFREEGDGIKIVNSGLDSVDHGTVTASCSEVDIPAVCGVTGKARFIYTVEGSPCVIIRNPVVTKYEDSVKPIDNSEEYVIKMSVSGTPDKLPGVDATPEPMTINFEFHHDQFAKSNFRKTTAGFEITVYSKSNPVHKLKFLKVLKENPVISTALFFTLGLVLCFFGLKFYRDMLMFFIPLMIVVLGFYLYLTIVEKSVETNDKLLLILVTLLCLAGFIALAVTFTNVIYVILCELTSPPRLLPAGRRPAQDAGALHPVLQQAPHRVHHDHHPVHHDDGHVLQDEGLLRDCLHGHDRVLLYDFGAQLLGGHRHRLPV